MKKAWLRASLGIAAVVEILAILFLEFGWKLGMGHNSVVAFTVLQTQWPGITLAKTILRWLGKEEGLSADMVFYTVVFLVQSALVGGVVFLAKWIYLIASRRVASGSRKLGQ